MKLYMRTRRPKYVHRFLQALFTEEDPFAVRFLSKVFLHFKMDFSPIPTINKEQAGRVRTPVFVVGADKDLMFPGKKLLQRAREIFPSLKGTYLLDNSRHVPNAADNERLVEWIWENSV
jgi:pimeloyl-ACP methyl ester carboxylesterase